MDTSPVAPRFEDPRFVIGDALGAGGMGTVWRAYDRLRGREVALKVGREAIAGPARVEVALPALDTARIAEEFSILATLDHPGVVRVLDFGVDGSRPWLTSEIVSGPRLDIKARRASGPLDELLADLLETLAWLHARGLVHGDLKPGNILVGPSGPVLIDFGLAGQGEALFGGTRAYLAPELQAARALPTPASDLYALGQTFLTLGLDHLSPGAAAIVEDLVRSAPERRPSALDAARRLRPGAAAPLETPISAWAAAIERARRALELRHLDLVLPDPATPSFLAAFAARLMLEQRGAGAHAAWVLPPGDGLAPLGQVLEALGLALALPRGVDPDASREVLDAFADASVAALAGLADERRPILCVPVGRLGAAARFVLARWVEAGALPRVVLAGPQPAAPTLERGVAHRFETLTILLAEATGRDLLAEWGDLSSAAREVALELDALGGAARADEVEVAPVLRRRGLAELGARGVTTRSADGRTALEPVWADALALVVPRPAPSLDERRAWLRRLGQVDDPPESMHLAIARHAEALALADRPERDEDLRLGAMAFEAATRAAERDLAWARAGAHGLASARLWLALDAGERAFRAARRAWLALRAAGGGPSFSTALELIERAVQALRADPVAAPDTRAELELEAHVLAARGALELGRPGDAIAAADALLAAATQPGRLGDRPRFEGLLVRGTARSRGPDKALAMADLSAAMALAESLGDPHAVARTANNLGMLAFHEGDLSGAADAWGRAASAKAQVGDRRGERIGLHNRGLALRELGRLDEAAAAATTAAALAHQIGDQVGRATALLAKAQLALDHGDPEAADQALTTFATIAWTPALVAADGGLVRVRLDLSRGHFDKARDAAQAALAAALDQGLSPVATEAWALLEVAARSPGPLPEPVAPACQAALNALGGSTRRLSGQETLLALVMTWREARAGAWAEARGHLEALFALPLVPPAATVALPLALEAARLAAPELAPRAEALLTATVRARAPKGDTTDPSRPEAQRAHQARLEKVRRALFPGAEAELLGLAAHESETRRLPRPADVAGPGVEGREPWWGPLAALLDALGDPPPVERLDLWPAALCAALRAQRAELVPLQGPIHHRGDDGVTGPRFTDLARRVATSGEPFFAQHADGDLACAAFPLTLGGAPVGSVVLGFGPAQAAYPGAALGRALGPTLALLALALAHRQEATHRARADAELIGLRAELEHHIERHEAEVTALRDALDQSQSALALRHDYASIVHRSQAMRRVLSTLDKVTPIDLPVLILGESGVGKELLAKALHFNGPRKQGRFVAENCGAIPRDLVESTLFGHVKGAFTGAIGARQGLFELAHGGTLFLDEIGELPLDVQVKLLRVLQERRVRPVGSNREIPVDFRLVAATHRDLAQMVAAGAFREDLYYRIAVVSLEVPPLRTRPEDIQPLADHFLKMHGERMGRGELRWGPDAVQRLLAHPWPGNVRELENEVLRAVALCEGDTIRPKHLSPVIAGRSEGRRRDAGPALEPRGLEPLEATVMRVERECLVLHLKASNGQKVGAARSLGLSRPGLDAKLARHGIDPKSLARRLKDADG